ncbi:MAG: hypothetical protein ACXW28_07975, partial [Thermoanaerobaculia bacterium]
DSTTRLHIADMRPHLLLSFLVLSVAMHGDPIRCGDGRVDQVIDAFESVGGWSAPYRDRDLPAVTLFSTDGCSNDALAVRWTLNGGEWIVLVRDLPQALDLTSFTHLRIALRGSNPNARLNLQIKLMDAHGKVFWTVAESVTDLPVWRPMYIDLRELTCFGDAAACPPGASLDRSRIAQIQIGIALCVRDGSLCEATEMHGGLDLDELAAVDLRPGAAHRVVMDRRERVIPDPDLRAEAAAAILGHQHANGLVPAWFPEATPNYNTYTEAAALLVFADEFSRTGDVRYRDAAVRLTEALLALQIAPPLRNAGAWMSAYTLRDGAIDSFDGSCTGDETLIDGDDRDLNRCMWVGNVGWAVIALVRARDAQLPVDRAALSAAIAAAVDWIHAQVGRMAAYPDLVTRGLEGNISAWFGLAAAGSSHANALADAIWTHGWDPVEQRLKMGVGDTDFGSAIDMSGSWGAQFLWRTGRSREALASQGYALSIFPTTSFDGAIDGLGDIAGPWTVTVEFGAQAAAAGIAGANAIMSEISRLKHPDGSFPGGTDDWYGGIGTPWTTTMTGVAPTAWVYFAQNGDPLLGRKGRVVRR